MMATAGRQNVRRILVSKIKHIGDTVLAIPALNALKEHCPDAVIDVIVTRGCACVLEGLPGIGQVIKSPRKGGLGERISDNIGIIVAIMEQRYDLYVDLSGGDRAMWYAILSCAPRRWSINTGAGAFFKRFVYTGYSSPLIPAQHTITSSSVLY